MRIRQFSRIRACTGHRWRCSRRRLRECSPSFVRRSWRSRSHTTWRLEYKQRYNRLRGPLGPRRPRRRRAGRSFHDVRYVVPCRETGTTCALRFRDYNYYLLQIDKRVGKGGGRAGWRETTGRFRGVLMEIGHFFPGRLSNASVVRGCALRQDNKHRFGFNATFKTGNKWRKWNGIVRSEKLFASN